MRIAGSAEVEYVLANILCDVDESRVVANLRWLVEGKDCGLVEVVAQGEDYAELLASMPAAGLHRAEDIAQMILNYAIAKGIVQGSIA